MHAARRNMGLSLVLVHSCMCSSKTKMLDKCVALSLELVLTIVLGLNAVNVNSGGIVPIILHVQCKMFIKYCIVGNF